jgi:hypothetical protein
MGERTALTKTLEKKAKDSATSKPKENLYESMDPPVEKILHLQRTIGNQAVQRLLKSGTIQVNQVTSMVQGQTGSAEEGVPQAGIESVEGSQSQTTIPAVPHAFTIALNNLYIVGPRSAVFDTIRQALEPLTVQAGRELQLGRQGSSDLELNFDAGGHESRPCGFNILGNEGGEDIFVGAHEDLRVCCGPRRDPLNPGEIDYFTQVKRVFDPDEPEFGRFVGNTAVHELGHIMAQLEHTPVRSNFMYSGNLPQGMRTMQSMRQHWAGQKSLSSDQNHRLVEAIRTNQFSGGMEVIYVPNPSD